MIDFGNCVLGFLLFCLGIAIETYIVRTKKETGEDTYGSAIKLGAAAIISILVGLSLFIKEVLKLV